MRALSLAGNVTEAHSLALTVSSLIDWVCVVLITLVILTELICKVATLKSLKADADRIAFDAHSRIAHSRIAQFCFVFLPFKQHFVYESEVSVAFPLILSPYSL